MIFLLMIITGHIFKSFTFGLNNTTMEENKRQKQVGKLIMEELSDIFQREGMNIVDGGMVSISKVMITPDLLEARVYLSFYQVKDPMALLHKIKERGWEWRKLLGQRIKNQLRRVPELTFFSDDTLDHVFKMEEIFKQIREQPAPGKENPNP
jgi:ribosome-binding factor A